MAESTGKKKVVKAQASGDAAGSGARAWTPTEEAKSKATGNRIVAALMWLIALGLESVGIWVVLPKVTEGAWAWWWLIILLVPIAIFAIIGNLLWKKANRLDPASKKDTVRFFIQNQLGAFITVLAFLPLIIVVLLDKEVGGKEKTIFGVIAALVMIGATSTGVSWDGGPSQEQYAEEENIIMQLTGVDEVFWVKGGSVFHVCEDVPDVNKESKDNQIYSGTVAAAHEAGKSRLTLRWESEATKYCGYTQEDVDAVNAGLSAVTDGTDESVDDDEPTADEDATTDEGGTEDGGADEGADE